MTKPQAAELRMYRKRAEGGDLPWTWAESRLTDTLTYWLVTTRRDGVPHPRPIWGVWFDDQLFLSVGSWEHWRAVQGKSDVAVHLDSSFEVVILEGTAEPETDRPSVERFVQLYNRKYDWDFDASKMRAPPVVVRPRVVMAWATKGRAGREGFANTAKWEFSG